MTLSVSALALKAFSLAGRHRQLQNTMKLLRVPSNEAQRFGKQLVNLYMEGTIPTCLVYYVS